MPVTLFFVSLCLFWGVQIKQESVLDKSSSVFSKNLLASPPAGTFSIFCFKQGQPQVGTVPLQTRDQHRQEQPGDLRDLLPAFGAKLSPRDENQGCGGHLRVVSSAHALQNIFFILNVLTTVAETMKKSFTINDAHFFSRVSLKSSCFWMCFSPAHTLCAVLDGFCFYPDFLPSARSSVLPSVPLEAKCFSWLLSI